jgi:hypothetical protein
MQPNPKLPSPVVVRRPALVRAAAAAFLIMAASSPLVAQTTTNDSSTRRRTGNDDAGNRRGGFNPEDMQARMLSSLRERLEVADDEEWKIISERLGKVMELRRNTAGAIAAFAGRGAPSGGGTDNRGGRSSRSSNPEINLLQSAIRDKLPDAEIKSRLDRVREMRKENDAKLSKAQEDLRAVLSVRQEAVAVIFGLLP